MPNAIFGEGIIEGEGPVAMQDGTVWAVEMAGSRACVTSVDLHGKVETRIKVGGRPNGMTVDGDGRIWVAEAREGVVLCFDPDGRLVKRITHPTDRFLWPNDLRFGPDGHLYLTDSGILDTVFITGLDINPDYATLPYRGCSYEIDPIKGQVVRQFDENIKFTNGIAFGPDNLLYINETLGGSVFRYDIFGSKTPRREVFGNVNKPGDSPVWRGPDGMAFGTDGNLYCTVYGQGDVTILNPAGEVLGRLPTNGPKPTNIAFAAEGRRAFVTEVSASRIEVLETSCDGLPLFKPRLAI
jgi:gluconolactonase